MKIRISIALAFLLLASASFVWGQTTEKPQPSPLQRRAAEVCALFRATPGDYEKLFSAEFLAKIPVAQLTGVFSQFFTQMGRCTNAKLVTARDENAGEFEFAFEKGFTVPGRISVNAAAPNLIEGLSFGAPVSQAASLADLVKESKTFPGETSLLIARLNDNEITPVVALNAERELAVGSTFKLYVLSELAREVNAKERKLSDVVTLDDRMISLPSGMLQTWPRGSPLTLHTLAAFMISISDNTAADSLLTILGRERVERMLAQTGHAKPDLNEPFLSTLEMFKLKGEPTHKAADEYLALDPVGRRRFLAERIAPIKREDTKPFPDGKPAYIDRIEWFASATDLCRVMNWLRLKTEGPLAAAPLREVLGINPGNGLNLSKERWSFIGYKGGSEPGVLNMTYLLKSTKGQWYALSLTWNDVKAPLDNNRVFGVVQRALQIIE